MSLEQLQVAVARGCAGGDVWAGRFAAGIRAALSFAVANPVAARALIDSRGGDPAGSENYRRLVDRFSAQLRECAPAGERLPSSSDEALVGSIAGVVSGYLHSGDTERLDEIAPHLVYMALLPYVGFDAARQWADPPARELRGTR